MPINLTLRELLEAQPALQRLAQQPLPVKLAYQLARIIKALQPELDEFHEQRSKLVKQYGATRPTRADERQQFGDEIVEVAPDHLARFRVALDELVSVPVTIDREPLHLDGACETIATADLIMLGPLLSDLNGDGST